ncbi:hypothetical protein D3C76_1392730 [compost metagenome]
MLEQDHDYDLQSLLNQSEHILDFLSYLLSDHHSHLLVYPYPLSREAGWKQEEIFVMLFLKLSLKTPPIHLLPI